MNRGPFASREAATTSRWAAGCSTPRGFRATSHSLAFNNRAEGFNANYHPGMLRFYNNTAFNNPRQFDLKVAPRLTKPVTHVLRNNIALGDAPPMLALRCE